MMTNEKLAEIQERMLSVLREYKELEVTDVISLFAFMYCKVIQMATLGNTEIALGVFRKMTPAIESMLKRPFGFAEIANILDAMNEINEREEEK